MYSWVNESHKLFRVLLALQLVVSVVIGVITGELLIAFWLGIPIVALPLFLSFTNPSSEVSAHAVGIGTQLMTALHIHQSFGLLELHFEIFAVLAVLVYFRNWKVIASATAVVAVHHIGFYILQVGGAGVFLLEENHVSIQLLLLHAVFALAEGIALMYMASRSHEEGVGAAALQAAIKEILKDHQRVNLNVKLDKSIPMIVTFDELLSSLRQLVKDTSSLSNNVAETSSLMQQSIRNLSNDSQQSSNEIGSISAASEEIALTLQETSQHTSEANNITTEAKENTTESRHSVENSKSTINSLRDTLNAAAATNQELNERCSSISEAMRSITAVAEQTNLLALNAAIESARAGEHGRGFAVVADEVRTLAIRSKESADEITSITEKLVSSTASSVSQMNECIELVDSAVEASDKAVDHMQIIETKIQTAADNMLGVATSAVEQQTASLSIAESTTRIHELVNNNARSSSELDAQSANLARMCEQIQETVKRFVV